MWINIKPRPRHFDPIISLGNSKYASGMQTEEFFAFIKGNAIRGFFFFFVMLAVVVVVAAVVGSSSLPFSRLVDCATLVRL